MQFSVKPLSHFLEFAVNKVHLPANPVLLPVNCGHNYNLKLKSADDLPFFGARFVSYCPWLSLMFLLSCVKGHYKEHRFKASFLLRLSLFFFFSAVMIVVSVCQPFWFLLLHWLWCCLKGDGWLASGRCDVSVQRFHWLPGLVRESCELNGPDKMNTVIRADPLARRPRWQTGVLHC